jgi:hypothetical protein
LHIDCGIHNERQDCKISKVCGGVFVGGRRVNGGDEGEGICLMGFTNIYKIEKWSGGRNDPNNVCTCK